MKAILYVLAIIVIGGAGLLTSTHSSKFKALQEVRIETVKTGADITASAEATESELKKERAALTADEQKTEVLTQSLSALKSATATMDRDQVELDNTLKGQEAEFAELNKTLAEVGDILKSLGDDVTLDNLADKIQQITDTKKEKEVKLEELITLTASAEKQLGINRADTDRMIKRKIDRNASIGRNSMEAVVSSVSQDWGFLVIGAGSSSGFAPQGALLIKRDGRLIARARPSSIEPSQTIAEIDFDSLAPGVRIQPGDRAILARPITR